MILTQCAFCAADLGLSLGKKCGRCATRYCGAECQKQHWESGGHDKLCKQIKKAGGAEQYNANKNYAEALVVAVEAHHLQQKRTNTYPQETPSSPKQPVKRYIMSNTDYIILVEIKKI